MLVDTEGDEGVRGQVGLDNAVGDVPGVAVVIDVGAAILINPDQTPANIGAGAQRAGNVAFAAIGVPGADGAADRGFECRGRALANQVDGRRGITRPGHQAGRALDDFDAVIGGHVGAGGAVVVDTVVVGIDAVVLEVGDRQATAGKLPALAVVILHADAGRAAQGVDDAGGALVVHELAGDDRDRLRRLAQGQRQAGG
ncbi:hypothetical protein D3C75_404700 [compost metagenome]